MIGMCIVYCMCKLIREWICKSFVKINKLKLFTRVHPILYFPRFFLHNPSDPSTQMMITFRVIFVFFFIAFIFFFLGFYMMCSWEMTLSSSFIVAPEFVRTYMFIFVFISFFVQTFYFKKFSDVSKGW